MEVLQGWSDWIVLLGVVVGGFVAGVLAQILVFRVLTGVGRRFLEKTKLQTELIERIGAPMRLLLGLAGVFVVSPIWRMEVSASTAYGVDSFLYIILVIAIAWLLTRVVGAIYSAIKYHVERSHEDNLEARKLLTHAEVIRRFMWVAICVLAVASILLHFDRFRELGAGLLASAGVLGIVLGVAAQRTLGTVIAGFQIALTQPIRVDDVVIVEGEWGRIEEITLTYVVVRIWDLRRLIVPINYFIEQPFQNWTREKANILGTVFLRVDYTVPFGDLRKEFERLLQESELWDGTVSRLHVTDAGERTVEVRALMSAKDSSTAWELRCVIREKLIEFLQKNYPHCLPKVRGELKQVEESQRDERGVFA